MPSSGVTFHGTGADNKPAEIPAETALAGAIPFVPVVDPTTGAQGTIPQQIGAKANRGHTAVADANYTVLVTDVHVGFTSLTASRVVTLCDVDTYPLGQDLVIVDEKGACSDVATITVRVGAGTGDTIPQTSSGTIVLASPYAVLRLRRGAANVWLIDNGSSAEMPTLTVKANTSNGLAAPQDVPLSMIAAPGNPVGDSFTAKSALRYAPATPTSGVAMLNTALAAAAHIVLPIDATPTLRTIDRPQIVPGGKTLEIGGGVTLDFGASGGIVLGDNAGYVTKTGGASKDVWYWGRNRAGAPAVGGDGKNLGFGGAAFHFDIPIDAQTIGTGFGRGLMMNHVVGAGFTGGRTAGLFQLYMNGASDPANTNRNYVALNATVMANAPDNGTSTAGKGVVFAAGFQSYCRKAAQYYHGSCVQENNSMIEQGATVDYAAGLSLVATHAARASKMDCALDIGAQAGSEALIPNHIGHDWLICINDFHGSDPTYANSILFGYRWQGGGARTIKTGIDLGGFVCTGNLLQGQTTQLSDTLLDINKAGATLSIGALGTASSPALRFRSGGGAATVDSRIIATGGGASNLAGTLSYQADAHVFTGTKFAVNGAAAVAKQTVSGSRGGNAALASLLTAIAATGLITDSTTA